MRDATTGDNATKERLLFQSTRPMRDATISLLHLLYPSVPFQSTRPMRDATILPREFIPFFTLFQSTRPMRDATSFENPVVSIVYFNPRVLCGTRRFVCCISSMTFYFNPRVLCGTRPLQKLIFLKVIIFQSTRPMRDATIASGLTYTVSNISIHASYAGRDKYGGSCSRLK